MNESKQDTDRQAWELFSLGVDIKYIYMEYESGTKANRPEWLKFQDLLKERDILVATEISRFTRSTKQLCDILEFSQITKI